MPRDFRFLMVLCLLVATAAHAETFLLNAEDLEMPGGWQVTSGVKVVHKYLIASADARRAPAAGAIELPHPGKWRLWVRSKDFPADRPGIRNFTVRLGDTRSATIFGQHGRAENEGWAWEDGGVFNLPAGPTLVALGDISTPSARCDALLFTDNFSYQPNDLPWKLAKPPVKTVALTIAKDSWSAFLPAPISSVEEKPAATLQNEALRLSFLPATTASGPAIALRAETRAGDRWAPLTDDLSAESYRVLFRPRGSDPKIDAGRVHPTWDMTFSPAIEVRAGASSVKTQLGTATAPWIAGRCFPLRPTGATQRDENTVALTFPETPEGQLTATWKLSAGQPAAEVSLDFEPRGPGQYSIGYHAPLAVPPADTDFVFMPFMFHGHRFPARPVAMLNATMPTPMTLVNRGAVSCALVADPRELPFEWQSASNSRYALGLRNEAGLAQPLLYSPVLGQPGSVSDGAAVHAQFRLWIQRGDWYATYRRVADEVFHLTDYRKPTTASLSDTALNLLDLIRNEKASGWDPRAKGPEQIESENVVSQSSPLTYMSFYLLTGDEDFYRRFALPSLEYMISRPGPHFSAEREIGDNYYHHQPLKGPGALFGASTFASAYAMTQGRSAAFGQFCLTDTKKVRNTAQNGHVQPFEDLLALYRLTGDQHWLDEARTAADKYIQANFTTLPSQDLGDRPFVNVSFVPDWEGLLHLAEVTGERRYLDAATEGARWLMTTLWTQPSVPDSEVVVNPSGIYDHDRHIWWWGGRLFRLGVYDGPATSELIKTPPPKMPEHRAPAWLVSNVGLGIEQPCTYTRNRNHANIMMSVWAPNLLRLAKLSRDPAFGVAARNATIGRFVNYPGYYLDGQTDAFLQPDYPLKGPDVTSLYVHHIPPFAAYVLDYLFTDAEMRSEGAVTFPSVRQCGYVWFDSRLRGHAPGKVYGQTAWPWLHRTAATVDTVNVDRVLAHGDGKFHVVLLNQVREKQPVRVSFDEKALGRAVEGARVSVRRGNLPAEPLTVENGAVEMELAPLEIAALTMDGVQIDVPTHRLAPPAHLSLPGEPGQHRAPIAVSKLEAVGTALEAPPFEWRDLYVYITAGLDDCRAAKLHYRIGDGPEQQVEADRFPFEFSARIADTKSRISWWVEAQMPDGQWRRSPAEEKSGEAR
jgi:hypothetical protein